MIEDPRLGDRVFVPSHGREGVIVLMVGADFRDIYVEMDGGAVSRRDLVWTGRPGKTDPEVLNRFGREDLCRA